LLGKVTESGSQDPTRVDDEIGRESGVLFSIVQTLIGDISDNFSDAEERDGLSVQTVARHGNCFFLILSILLEAGTVN
jgi:hypothetical protein